MQQQIQLNDDDGNERANGKSVQPRYLHRTLFLVALDVVGIFLLLWFTRGITDYGNWATVVAASIMGLLSLNVVIISAITSTESKEISEKMEREARLQRIAIRDSANFTESIVKEMQGQRELMMLQAAQNAAQLVSARDQSTQMIRQVDIMGEQLCAMKEQLKVMDDTSFIANRGHLSIHAIHDLHLIDGGHPQVIITWDNDGDSPLSTIEEGSHLMIKIEGRQPYKGECDDICRSYCIDALTIAPHSSGTQRINDLSYVMASAQIKNVETEQEILSVCGTIVYETLGRRDQLDICAFWYYSQNTWLNCTYPEAT